MSWGRPSKRPSPSPWEGLPATGITGLYTGNNVSKNQRVYDFNRSNDKQAITRNYWDTYNKREASKYNQAAQNFLGTQRTSSDRLRDVWENQSWSKDQYESAIKNYNNKSFNYNPNFKTDFSNAKSIGMDFNSKVEQDFADYKLKANLNNISEFYNTYMDKVSDTYGFDKNIYKSSMIPLMNEQIKKHQQPVFDPYEVFKRSFVDNYYDHFDTQGYGFIKNDAKSQQYVQYLKNFGAQNSQDAEIMALLNIDAPEFGSIDGFSLNADEYSLDKSWEDEYDQIKYDNNLYFREKDKSQSELDYIRNNMDSVDADSLNQRLSNFDSGYLDWAGGKEDFFSDFYDPYNQYNQFADDMRGNADSLEEQLSQLSIRDIDQLREGRASIDDYTNQINNFESDLTGLNRSELLLEFNNLLNQNTEDGRGGFQGLIDEWTKEDSKIQTARDKLGNRDEKLAEMLADLGIYNKDSLDLFQDNFDQLDKYRSDYDGEDKFTSKLDFDFSNEFSDIDSVMADYMAKYDQRQSELDSLFMKDGSSLEDLLSGTAENDLDGFTELQKLLSQNKNELGKFTGDDLADESSLFESLFSNVDDSKQNIFDQRSDIESSLTDILERIRSDDFYDQDDLSEYRDLLSSNNDLIDYWGAEGAKEESGLLDDEITGESDRLVQEDKNVANYRQSQKEMILEVMRKNGGKLEFNDLPFNDLSDAEIARLFMGTRDNFDDPDKLNSIFSQIGGS